MSSSRRNNDTTSTGNVALDKYGSTNKKPQQQKKSKLEKICELECSLKAAEIENQMLRKRLHEAFQRLSSSSPTSSAQQPTSGDGDGDDSIQMQKMKDAIKALKRLTMRQQMGINSMRAKANQRRDELKQRDATITQLEKQVQCLQQVLNTGGLEHAHQVIDDDEQTINTVSPSKDILKIQYETEIGALRKQLKESQQLALKLMSGEPIKTHHSQNNQGCCSPVSNKKGQLIDVSGHGSFASQFSSSLVSIGTGLTESSSYSHTSATSSPQSKTREKSLRDKLVAESNRVRDLERELQETRQQVMELSRSNRPMPVSKQRPRGDSSNSTGTRTTAASSSCGMSSSNQGHTTVMAGNSNDGWGNGIGDHDGFDHGFPVFAVENRNNGSFNDNNEAEYDQEDYDEDEDGVEEEELGYLYDNHNGYNQQQQQKQQQQDDDNGVFEDVEDDDSFGGLDNYLPGVFPKKADAALGW